MKIKNTDVIVVGGGHAGIEAALASARLGCKTTLITLSKKTIGLMPCNPSIGGPAKGQIVGEIDALGGEMGRAADKTHIQLKVLNRSRGPAVQCLRSQNDKDEYNLYMREFVNTHPNIDIIEEEISELIIENKTIKGVKTQNNAITAHSVVITAGTFLKSVMHTGLTQASGGRIGEQSCNSLSGSLSEHLELGRLKTGTPPRLDSNSIDTDKMLIQPGDDEFLHFSFKTTYNSMHKDQLPCYRTRTTLDTHNIILNNLDRSPLYTKTIKGIGPRYCPSIEDKIVRFKDKDTHYIFIEPEGRQTNSIYPQGLNTSLPQDVQEAMLKSMPGLENVSILKYGYAVEYDFVKPHQLKHSLECNLIENLFFAGQLNGTSGYEEAAGQGIIAGTNAALKAQGRPAFILTREDSFIGTLIDDLITKPIVEPYRMLTSRSEYRLLLRQDNPTERLSEKAYQAGLLSKESITLIQEQHLEKERLLKAWRKGRTNESHAKKYSLKHKIPLTELAKRPNVLLSELLDDSQSESKEAAEKALIEIRYEGYIRKQEETIAKLKKFHEKPIPKNINIDLIPGLRAESRQRLKEAQPKTFYEASRIAGINPADLSVLMIFLEKHNVSRETKKS